MSIHRASSVVCLSLATVLLGIACDDERTTSVSGPSVAGPHGGGRASATQNITVSPSQIQPLVLGTSCPDARFIAPFTLGISGNGFTDLFLAQVDLQFVDRIGVTTPMLSISRAALIERFASTRITALETRVFPFEFPLGCTSAPSGTLTISVVLADAQQHERRTTMTMPVR
jgi:hypothetical protein